MWSGYSILCPSLTDVILQGDSSSFRSITFGLNIARCNPEIQKQRKLKPCYSTGKINNWVKTLSVEMWNIEQNMDFSSFGKKPTYAVNTHQIIENLDPNYNKVSKISIVENEFLREDNLDFFRSNSFDNEGKFYKVKKVLKTSYHNELYTDKLFTSRFILDSEKVFHRWISYSVGDFIGDIGGFVEIVYRVLAALTFPFSQFSFHLKAI